MLDFRFLTAGWTDAITLAEAVFWVCAVLVVLTYAAYPSFLWLLQRRAPRFPPDTPMPRVSLVISAFNEESTIGPKIANSLALDYPNGALEIIVISDASTDGTDEIVRDFADQGVVLCRQEQRAGKSAGLTRFVPQAKGEILVFSDANSMYESDAIRKLVRHFSDEQVGFVAGHQRYHDSEESSSTSESLYWRYETAVKVFESRVGSVVCGDGAIYAIRSELFEPLAADDINDFALPLKIIIRGYRGVFDREAICYEHAAGDFAGEFRRRVRIVNRSFRAVCRNWRALSPFHVGWFAMQLFVHKVVRWFVPFLLFALLTANVAVIAAGGGPYYVAFLALQVICYVLAALHAFPPLRRYRPVYVCYYFCLANAAAGLGILTYFTGKRFQTWTPERNPHPEGDPIPVPDAGNRMTVSVHKFS
ncbi:MAG: glycosyltransferase family 2 protein [Planctomycetaceae bacterium]|nr:glycosyltransferase family 2 protein [Planctomycetaceae bacterium]